MIKRGQIWRLKHDKDFKVVVTEVTEKFVRYYRDDVFPDNMREKANFLWFYEVDK